MGFFTKKGDGYSKEEIRTNRDLLFGLKCTSCEKYMYEPIRQCIQGHSFCQECGNGHLCKICLEAIVPGTNRHLESIARKVKFPCCNSEEGCNRMFQKLELDSHEQRCGFGQHHCLMEAGCHWSGRKEMIYSHVNKVHSKEVIMSKSNYFTIKNFSTIRGNFVRLLRAYNDVFWCHHKNDDQAAYWTVQYLGSDIHCPKYTYTLKLHHFEDKKKYICFKNVDCLKNSDNVEEAYRHVSCVKIAIETVSSFLSLDGNINCTIKLRKNSHVVQTKYN